MNLNRVAALVALSLVSSFSAVSEEAAPRHDAPQYRQEANGEAMLGRLDVEEPTVSGIVSEDVRRSSERCCNVPNDPVAY